MSKVTHTVFTHNKLYKTISLIGLLSLPFTANQSFAEEQANPPENSGSSSVQKAAKKSDNSKDESKNAEKRSDKSQEPLKLSTVIVTSQKREEAAQKVPTTLNVLSGKKFLAENVGTSAQEVLNYIPNASAYGSGHGKPRWWIRGIGTGNPQPDATSPVGVYHDDVYIANSEATGLPIFDLERVEVLSGPQGTLWGKNTTGGALNIISRQPKFKSDGYLKFGYGQDDAKTFEGAVGGTLIDEKLAGRFSFHRDEIGPRYDNLTTGGKEGTQGDTVLRAQFLADISEEASAILNLHHRRYNTAGGSPKGLYPNAGADYYYPIIKYTPPEYAIDGPDSTSTNQAQRDQDGVNLKVKWQIGEYELTSITAYDKFDSHSKTGAGLYSATATDNTNTENQTSQEIRIASPRTDQLNWIGGFHYFNNEYQRTIYTATFKGILLPTNIKSASNRLVDQGYSFDSESYAIFGSTTYNATDKFDITGGLRFTKENKTVQAYKTTYGPTTSFGDQINWLNTLTKGAVLSGESNTFTEADANYDKSWNAVTYDVTPAYKLSDTKRVYLRYAHGVKAGGFNTNISSAAQLTVLSPEKLDSLEAGYKSELFNNRLNLNGAIFGYNFKDAQVNISGPYGALNADTGVKDNLSVLQNIPKGTGYGAEITLQALVTDQLSINANLGLLRTKFDDFTVQNTTTRLVDSEFVRSPHVTGLLQADYRIPISPGNITLSADWRYQARQFFYVNNQDNPLLQQPAYSLVNARISYASLNEKDTITFYLNNVLDEKYYVHASVVSQSPSVNGWGRSLGDERAWGLTYVRRW